MAWYYWLYLVIAVVWFLDLYSTTMRAAPPNFYGDLVVKPIFIAVLSALWPLTFCYFMWKRRKVRGAQEAPSND